MKISKGKLFDLSHLTFSIVFTTLLYLICNALNLDKIVKWFSLGNSIDYSGLVAYLIIGLCFFLAFFILFAHRWTIKPLSIIFVVLSAAVAYFISKYNVAIDRTMVMNVIHTDFTEVKQLLSFRMIPYVIFLIIFPILVIANVNITFSNPARYLSESLLIFTLAVGIGMGLVYTNYQTIHRAVNISNKYIIHTLVPVNFIRSTASALHRSIESYNRKHKREVQITGHISSQDDLVVVLTIGEGARQKSFSLYGYSRKNTNPALSEINNLHTFNGKADIGTTLLALQNILERKDIKLPAITSQLGVDTSCYVNYTLYDSCDSVGEVHVDNCSHEGKCYDEDVIPLLENNLKTYVSGYRFIILHLGGGSHGPRYNERHPPEFQYFMPQCLAADVVNDCTIEQLYNSYDNSILYTDYVLGNIIKKLELSGAPYVFMYISDHGESLMEEGRLFHGMPPGISLPPEQAQVPLIVKSSVPIATTKREEYHLQDVFDTVLNLFSIETEVLNKESVFIEKIKVND